MDWSGGNGFRHAFDPGGRLTTLTDYNDQTLTCAYDASANGFLWPQIVLHAQDRFTLPIALNPMVGLYEQEYGSLMAGRASTDRWRVRVQQRA
jgi:hypothetical protein